MRNRYTCGLILLSSLWAGILSADDQPRLPWVGLSFTWSETAARMLHVRSVTAGGPAARGGVRAGDFVTTINGVAVDFGDELEFLLFIADRNPGERLRLGLIREGRAKEVLVTLAQLADQDRPKWQRNLERARRKRAERQALQP